MCWLYELENRGDIIDVFLYTYTRITHLHTAMRPVEIASLLVSRPPLARRRTWLSHNERAAGALVNAVSFQCGLLAFKQYKYNFLITFVSHTKLIIIMVSAYSRN